MLQHPFEWLDISAQKRAFVIFFILTLVTMIGMGALGRPLDTDAAPDGIVSFEFAGNLTCAKRIVESWGPTGRVHAGLNLGLDYLFLVVYANCIALGCVLVAQGFSGQSDILSRIGGWLAWAGLGAGLLDTVENYALIQVLLGSERSLWPAVAKWCAGPKFVIVGAGLVYVLVGGIAVIWIRSRGRERAEPG